LTELQEGRVLAEMITIRDSAEVLSCFHPLEIGAFLRVALGALPFLVAFVLP